MISTITVIILVVLGVAAVVVFSSITFIAEFTGSDAGLSGSLNIQWMHPRIARLTYDIGNRRAALKIMGWTRTLRREDGDEKREAYSEERVQQPDVQKHEENRGTPDTSFKKQACEEPAARGEKKISGWRKITKTAALLDTQHVPARAFRWCGRVARLCFRMMRFDHFRLRAKAGAGDPAETGKLYGWYAAASQALFSRQKNVDVRFEPQFSGDVLEFEGRIGLRTSIARIGVMAGIAFITFPYYTAYRVWRRLKKDGIRA